MPEIPRFSSTVVAEPVPSRVGASQIVPAAGVEFGQQIQRSAGLLAQVEIRRHEALDQAEATQLLVNAEVSIEERRSELEQNPDPRTHASNLLAQSEEVRREMLAQASNENVKQMLGPKLALTMGRQYLEARKTERRWTIEQSKAALIQISEVLERRATEALDPRDREQAIKELDAEWDSRTAYLGADDVERGKQAARKRIIEGTVLRDIRVNPTQAIKNLDAKAYGDLTEAQDRALRNHAEAAEGQLLREMRLQKEEREEAAKDYFYQKLRGRGLNTADLEALRTSPSLSAGQKEWIYQLAKQGGGKTDPETFIGLTEMLDPKGSREESIESARTAIDLAKEAYRVGTLSQRNAMQIVQRGERIVRGEMFESHWFRAAKAELKGRLGWLGDDFLGRFATKEEGGDSGTGYHQVLEQLMDEIEQDPNLRGRAIMKRARELSSAPAINAARSDDATVNPSPMRLAPDPADALPDASQHTGETIRNSKTGQRLESNGVRWVPVPEIEGITP